MKIKLRGHAATRRIWLNDKELFPEKSQEYRNHSPDGFNWGYGGSGPAQLALAILLELFPLDRPDYQKFKWKFITKLPLAENFDVRIEFDEKEFAKPKAENHDNRKNPD